MKKPYVLILAGGSGTRLWPLSRNYRPKQLLPLYSEKSLIAETYLRALQLTPAKNIFIGTGKKLKKAIKKELGIPKEQFIIEPVGRNTAPIIALFCSWLKQLDKDMKRPVVVLSSDHYINPVSEWVNLVESICLHANERIWCMGVKPTRPDTGYGYIETGAELGTQFFEIASFREKPDLATAQGYFNSKQYLWNVGMFVFSAQLFRDELKKHAPEILKLADQCIDSDIEKVFPGMPDISVDYAILEKSSRLGVAAGNFTWDDVGAFDSITRIQEKDTEGNYATAGSQYQSLGSTNNVLYTKSKVALLGVSDLVITECDGVLLVANRKSLNRIKELREKFPKEDL